MKRLILFAATALTLTMAGCKSGDPKSVLTGFLTALAKKDINGAKKYATKESASMLDFMGVMLATQTDKLDVSKLEIGEPKIDGDKAVIETKDKATGKIEKYNLRKEDGSWKVAFDKTSQNGSDKMNDQPTNSDHMNTDTTHQ